MKTIEPSISVVACANPPFLRKKKNRVRQRRLSPILFEGMGRLYTRYHCSRILSEIIVGDPGAVSWVGRKGGTNVFKA